MSEKQTLSSSPVSIYLPFNTHMHTCTHLFILICIRTCRLKLERTQFSSKSLMSQGHFKSWGVQIHMCIYTQAQGLIFFFFFLTHPLFKIPYSNNSDDWTRTTKCKYKWETIKSFQHFLWSLTQWEGRRLLGG